MEKMLERDRRKLSLAFLITMVYSIVIDPIYGRDTKLS